MSVVDVRHLEIRYDEFVAIRNVSFSIDHGEVFGFLGPNGAGKSTILKVLSTLKKPYQGQVVVEGCKIPSQSKSLRSKIAVLSQQNSLDLFLNVYDNLYFCASLHRIPRHLRHDHIMELLDIFGLKDKEKSSVMDLSGGLFRRVQLAKLFLSEASIYLLDEPTLGFDVRAKAIFWRFLKNLCNDKGITVILATNDMAEAEATCDRIAFIKNGQIAALDTPSGLTEIIDMTILSVQYYDVVECNWKQLDGIERVSRVEPHSDLLWDLELRRNGHDYDFASLIRVLQGYGRLRSLTIRQPNLNDVFRTLNQDNEHVEHMADSMERPQD